MKRAEQMHRRGALAGKDKVLGPDHTSTLDTVNNLGVLYANQGKLVEAEKMYIRALAGLEKALGVDHPNILVSMNNLASALRLQEKYVETESLMRRALAGRKKILHSDMMTTSIHLLSSELVSGHVAVRGDLHYSMQLFIPPLFVIWKVLKKTKMVKAHAADPVWQRPFIDAYEATFIDPSSGFWKEMVQLVGFKTTKGGQDRRRRGSSLVVV
ncbi:hypothetical protein LTR41_011928 [Exophiala xenobiotica]|nr:hypothetical protein LTR41_011928 [Exophiala xenobiotica]KAK5549288.1 hypothetical protein LTR46_011929 [Exophiala xenobiotica]